MRSPKENSAEGSFTRLFHPMFCNFAMRKSAAETLVAPPRRSLRDPVLDHALRGRDAAGSFAAPAGHDARHFAFPGKSSRLLPAVRTCCPPSPTCW